ncbi:MAG: alpha/beta hydrolase [Beijerinckiaceae bacterium]|nr:alpha/beta hydrolase [Beijerinckiaceae bacterium]
MRVLKFIVRLGLIIVLGAYAGVVVWLYLNQRDLVFRPEPDATDAQALELGDFRDVEITTRDEQRLRALYRPADPGRATILYLHGNAARLRFAADRLRSLSADGNGLLFVSYRGFSGSTGSPSEDGLAEDARAAYDWLRGVARNTRIILYGESLGTGVAVRLATTRPVSGLVLDAPFTSTVDVARRVHWYAPVSWLMLDRFESINLIARVRAPILFLHGDADRVVPFDLGQKLFAAANPPKKLVRIPDGSHSRNLEAARADVMDFVQKLEVP